MLEDPYEFQPQPGSRFWGWTLFAWLIFIALAGVGIVKCAQAAPTFNAFGMDGNPAALELRQTPCENAAVVKHLREKVKPEYISSFRAAVLTWGGKQWASCWIERDGVIFSIDEEGSYFQPTPRRFFRDNAI